MPTFFSFQQGTESRQSADASPLLGRFRAVPGQARRASLLGKRDSILASLGGSVGYGYGTLFRTRSQGSECESSVAGEGEDDEGSWISGIVRRINDVWIEPKQGDVRRMVDWWWKRWGVLYVLPAAIVSPFPRASPREEDILTERSTGGSLVRASVSTISTPRRLWQCNERG